MASSKMKPINNNVLGSTKKKTSEEGPYGGGNAYRQMNPSKPFELVKPHKGHTQKLNLKK